MNFLELSKARYSVRAFSSKPVEQEKLDAVLEAGRLAPTAKNSQAQKIFVLKSPEALERINKVTPMTYKAPVVLLVCYDKNLSYVNQSDTHYVGYEGGLVDSAIITTAMMMEATDLGLGTLWARGFNSQDIFDAFPEIKGLEVVCLLDIGYPADNAAPSERHTQRRPLSETVVTL